MYEHICAVVLHVIKYSDKNSIVHVLTSERGRMSFLLPQGSSKSAKMRNAIFMPLSIIEFEARILPNRDIHTFRSPQLMLPLTGIYGDPIKNAIAMFMAEIVERGVQGGEETDSLYKYLVGSIQLLDKIEDGKANFHICFMFHLGAFLGIQPDTYTYKDGSWFDMENGMFTEYMPLGDKSLPPSEAKVIMLLSRMNFSNMYLFAFNRVQRNEILDLMIKYYQLHNSTIGSLRSPDILKQLFD